MTSVGPWEPIQIVEVRVGSGPIDWPFFTTGATRAFVIVWVERQVVWTGWERLTGGDLTESAKQNVLDRVAWPIWQLQHSTPREPARIGPGQASVVVCTRDRTDDDSPHDPLPLWSR